MPPGNIDAALLARLKGIRLEIARAEGMPALAVFHDRNLKDMVARKPQSLERLADCHGVGAAKLDRYCERFLAVLKDADDSPPVADKTPEEVQRAPASEPVLAGGFDSRLIRRLKALRLQVALQEDVPPHAVLHKFSLQEMAANRPQTLVVFAECYSLDAKKIGRYGERFLAGLKSAMNGGEGSADIDDPDPQHLVGNDGPPAAHA